MAKFAADQSSFSIKRANSGREDCTISRAGFSDEELISLARRACNDEEKGRFDQSVQYQPGWFSAIGSRHSQKQQRTQLIKATALPPWIIQLQRMIAGLPTVGTPRFRYSSLYTLCDYGARYGRTMLHASTSEKLLSLLTTRALASATCQLRRDLMRVSRSCLALEMEAFKSAFNVVYAETKTRPAKPVSEIFLGENPCQRLFILFRRYPVLARLWCQLISQWRDNVVAILARFLGDRRVLARILLHRIDTKNISDLQIGLSDPHNGGRTVARLRFGDKSVIYKPRPGECEQEWAHLIRHLNRLGFCPALRVARVVNRKRYCWMEYIRSDPCKNESEVGRFYRRLGALIALAHLTKAVDCHRENLILWRDYPVLVDVEALCETQNAGLSPNALESLTRTALLSTETAPSSLYYRSNALGNTAPVENLSQLGPKTTICFRYQKEIVWGFCKAWRCFAERGKSRTHLTIRLRVKNVRRLHRTTLAYDKILRSSTEPAALREEVRRRRLITRLCYRDGISKSIMSKEIDALERLDIPYFRSKLTVHQIVNSSAPSGELLRALKTAAIVCLRSVYRRSQSYARHVT